AGSYSLSLDGLYSSQQGYDLTFVNGNLTINPAPLTAAFGVVEKVYDGNSVATLTPAHFLLSGWANGEGTDVSVTQTVGSYASRHVGTGITVTTALDSSSFAATSTNLANYILPASVTSDSGKITQLDSVEWIGGSSGDWLTASNWFNGALPDLNPISKQSNVAQTIFPTAVTITSGVPLFLGSTGITANGSSFSLEVTGGLDTGSGTINVPAGTLRLATHSPLVVGSGGLSAGTGITLKAETADSSSTITLNGAISSTSGSATISAFGDVAQNAAISAPAVGVASTSGNIVLASTAVTNATTTSYAAPAGSISASNTNFSGGSVTLSAPTLVNTSPTSGALPTPPVATSSGDTQVFASTPTPAPTPQPPTTPTVVTPPPVTTTPVTTTPVTTVPVTTTPITTAVSTATPTISITSQQINSSATTAATQTTSTDQNKLNTALATSGNDSGSKTPEETTVSILQNGTSAIDNVEKQPTFTLPDGTIGGGRDEFGGEDSASDSGESFFAVTEDDDKKREQSEVQNDSSENAAPANSRQAQRRVARCS
ncbi:MAG: hypothetical protein HQL49_08370, partial [Gammaproteobacteria bacterium]|nr:hypothetical protein [Gammaproteobacteria bacterium]